MSFNSNRTCHSFCLAIIPPDGIDGLFEVVAGKVLPLANPSHLAWNRRNVGLRTLGFQRYDRIFRIHAFFGKLAALIRLDLIGSCKCPMAGVAANQRSLFHCFGFRVSLISTLVNIRRKALLSSVGFRKRMTSRSPRGSLCDSCKFRFDRPLRCV